MEHERAVNLERPDVRPDLFADRVPGAGHAEMPVDLRHRRIDYSPQARTDAWLNLHAENLRLGAC